MSVSVRAQFPAGLLPARMPLGAPESGVAGSRWRSIQYRSSNAGVYRRGLGGLDCRHLPLTENSLNERVFYAAGPNGTRDIASRPLNINSSFRSRQRKPCWERSGRASCSRRCHASNRSMHARHRRIGRFAAPLCSAMYANISRSGRRRNWLESPYQQGARSR